MILLPDGTPAPKRQRANTWQQIYEAAERSDFRGYFYIPSLDPVEQLDSMTSRTLAEKNDWLYKNVGAVAMVIDGLALDEVGTGLWPKWQSKNPAFNKSATDSYHFTNRDPEAFSADGRDNAYSMEFAIRRAIRLYGDAFGQFIEPGEGETMPRMQLIPGYRCDNFGDEKPGDNLRNGIRTNRANRAISFRIINGTGSNRSYTDVPASQMRHFHDPFLPGQLRGTPALAAVAKRLFRREDILAALTNGTLLREKMGFAIQTQKGGMAKPVVFPGEGSISTEENDDGSKFTVQKLFGEKARDDISIPELQAGAEIKLLESSRPNVAVTDFLDQILREVAWTTTYPPEYIFFLAGMGQGTAVRLVLQKVKGVIGSKREFQLLPQFLIPWHTFWVWTRIRTGAFDSVEGGIPSDWWNHKIIYPADMTVDQGREGRLYDERVSTNRMGIEAYHGMSGEDAGDVEDENLAAIDRRLAKLDALNKARGTAFEYFDIWPRTISAPAPVTAQPEPVTP